MFMSAGGTGAVVGCPVPAAWAVGSVEGWLIVEVGVVKILPDCCPGYVVACVGSVVDPEDGEEAVAPGSALVAA